MRGFLSRLCLLAIALTSLAQTPPPRGEDGAKQPAPCTVSGRIVSAAEGTPIKSARVALKQEQTKSDTGVFGSTTDGDGRFEVKNVPPGRYMFFASHTGYIGQQYRAKGTNEGAMLALAPGQEFADALFRLVRAAAVTGHVVDESGEPLQSVQITALRKPNAEEEEEWGVQTRKERLIGASTTFTDDRGEFRLFGLRPGEYYLKAAESSEIRQSFGLMNEEDARNSVIQYEFGSEYAPLYYPGVLHAEQAEAISLRGGEEAQADFAMRHVKTVEVSGLVVGPDGKPATRAYVALSLPEIGTWSDQFSTITDEAGKFLIKRVPSGSYVLDAQQQDADKHQMARQKLEVGDQKIDSLVIIFGRGVTISGHFTTASAGGLSYERLRIFLQPASEDESDPFGWGQTKKDGSFEIQDVADGDYALHVSGLEPGWYVKSARHGAEDVLQKGVHVERSSSSGTLAIVLSSASAQLEGSVTNHDKPVAGAKVRVRPNPETPYNRMLSESSSTDQNGHFTINDLAPGQYRVIAKLPTESGDVPAITSEPQIITLGEHDHQTAQLVLKSPEN